MIKLYNTLSRKKEIFKPIKKGKVGLYTCGPTVYWYAHIGNLRTYLFEDILRRVLEYNNYDIMHVMNITDVGHLTSDSDTGEDKMEKGSKRENKTVWEIAEHYTDAFKEDLKKLNIKEPSYWTKVTDYIKEQIDLIKELEKKGYTYLIEDGVYFDTSKIEYGELWGSKKISLKAGARIEMVKGKKNITDFALWKLTPKGVERQMEWNSPWGKGFPGWHTECVVMSKEKLGIPFDIHCGGIDHIQIHHTNEIAQSRALFKKNPANYWLHGEFLKLKDGKMSKSKGGILRLSKLNNPLSYRYLCLNAHYRSHINFSFQALESAENSLNSLREKIIKLKEKKDDKEVNKKIEKEYLDKFKEFINDDLNTPKALSLLWKLIKDKRVSSDQKYIISLNFDKVLGLGIDNLTSIIVPKEVEELLKERNNAREKKDFKKADQIREELEKLGYKVEDKEKDSIIKRI